MSTIAGSHAVGWLLGTRYDTFKSRSSKGYQSEDGRRQCYVPGINDPAVGNEDDERQPLLPISKRVTKAVDWSTVSSQTLTICVNVFLADTGEAYQNRRVNNWHLPDLEQHHQLVLAS